VDSDGICSFSIIVTRHSLGSSTGTATSARPKAYQAALPCSPCLQASSVLLMYSAHLQVLPLAGAVMVEHREDEANKALVQQLVQGLRAHVHVGGQHCDVGVAVVPADHTCAYACDGGEASSDL
jgi:hypothetical protein